MQNNKEIIKEALELFQSKGIIFRDNIGHFTIEKLLSLYSENEALVKSRIMEVDELDNKALLDLEEYAKKRRGAFNSNKLNSRLEELNMSDETFIKKVKEFGRNLDIEKLSLFKQGVETPPYYFIHMFSYILEIDVGELFTK